MNMTKFILALCILAIAFMPMVVSPSGSMAYSGQLVGGATYRNIDGVVLSSCAIISGMPFNNISTLSSDDMAIAQKIFAKGNSLYRSYLLLQGMDVIISVYSNDICGTICIENLYQDNQRIVGYRK